MKDLVAAIEDYCEEIKGSIIVEGTVSEDTFLMQNGWNVHRIPWKKLDSNTLTDLTEKISNILKV